VTGRHGDTDAGIAHADDTPLMLGFTTGVVMAPKPGLPYTGSVGVQSLLSSPPKLSNAATTLCLPGVSVFCTHSAGAGTRVNTR
jgi:hypothetical protein